MKPVSLNPLFSEEAIAKRVRELAGEINACYAGKHLLMIGVLKGSFMFFSDLLKHVSVGPAIDFVRIASYGDGAASSGSIRFSKDVELPLAGKDVLLVEDIIDSGVSMDFLLREMRAREVNSLRLAVLLDQRARRQVEVPVDFVGFTVQSGFIVGYGLDYAERYRELPALYTVAM